MDSVVLGIRFQRYPRRDDRHDLDRVRTQPIEHAIPFVDELAQLPSAVLGDRTSELRMILKPMDALNQFVNDLRCLLVGYRSASRISSATSA